VSYQRKSLQILGGGFNLLPPVDKVPQTDYLLAQNWRVDRLGRLVGRYGYPEVFSISGAGLAHSAGSIGGAASPYYVGCNSAINSPASALYYDGNSTPIASGFDGNRIGFASQNGFMYAMNRAVQGRHSPATGWQNWNLTAPPASPTVAAGSSPSPVSSATYNYGTYGTTIAASISAGTRTVTPASMVLGSGQHIIVGLGLIICDAGSTVTEVVTVTAVTGSTFTAVFRNSYTGPGIFCGEYGYVHSLTIAGTTYSFADIGYSNAQVPGVMAGIAGSDPNATVTYSGSGNSLVIAPILTNTLIPISGSDGNTAANLANGTVTTLPNGTYQVYLTFVSADLTLESNPSPPALSITVTSQTIVVTIPSADAPVDTRIGFVNIYAIGGTLGQAYLVGQVPSTASSAATTFNYTLPDLQVTNRGVVMPTANDPPPAASGIIGPYFDRLFSWSTATNPNRLFYTEPGLPQYWPGSANPQGGDWVDVGDEGEAIVWCTIHTNTLVIYKEKSIWMLIGPPDTGTLQQYRDGLGLTGQFALVSAGLVDYFVGPGGLHKFDLNNVSDVDAAVTPLFTGNLTGGAVEYFPPGSVLPGSAFNSNSTSAYACSLGYGMGKLYIGYAEQVVAGSSFCLLVYHEDSGRWFYHRNAVSGATGFFGWFFDGTAMIGLTGAASGAALGLNVDDFRAFATTDAGSAAIECVYQSHYEDCGMPDNQKMWLEAAVDCEYVAANVYAHFDNGATSALIGTITSAARATYSFSLAAIMSLSADGGILAKNISITVDASAGTAVIHNVYLYYYVEARQAASASTIPVDLGVGLVKQCKELQLDIDRGGSAAQAIVSSDLPGNALTTRETISIGSGSGRAILKFPFSVQEGFLWQLSVTGTLFRLYAARLLMRVVGTYIEAYEAAAGFVWDSQEMTFDSGITHIPRGYSIALAALPVKRAREISLEIDTVNEAVTLTLLTDLPGNSQTSRFTATVTANGRRFVRIPLAQGTSAPIEGRIYRIQLSGSNKFILYDAAIDVMPVGVYIEAYEAAGSPAAVWDSTTVDLGDPGAKTIDEIRIEMDSDSGGSAYVALYTDLPGEAQALRGTYQLTSGATGRAWVTVPVYAITGLVEARSIRLLVSSGAGFRIYAAQVRYGRIGRYIAAASLAGTDQLNTLEYDFEAENNKMYKRVECDLNASGTVTINVITSQETGGLSTIYTTTLTTAGRQAKMIPLPPGVRGRLFRVQIYSTDPARIYHVRAQSRNLNDAQARWEWKEYPVEPSSLVPEWKQLMVAPTPEDWFWAKCLSVAETPDSWQWVDVPFDVSEPS
jgi:hypothetical protein